MSLNGTLRASVSLAHSKDNVDLSTPTEAISQNASKTFSSGNVYHDQIDLTASTAHTLTLSGGGLTDVFGQSFDIATVKGVYVKAPSTNTGTVAISGGPDMIFNPLPALAAGQGFLYEGDITVNVTNDELTFVPTTSGAVDVIIVGA